MPNLSIQKLIMLKLITLSDTQSELMQGGWDRAPKHPKYKPCKPKHPHGYGHNSVSHKNVSVITGQESVATALTLGRGSLATNDMTQLMTISINA
jgi:hypothetical protein